MPTSWPRDTTMLSSGLNLGLETLSHLSRLARSCSMARNLLRCEFSVPVGGRHPPSVRKSLPVIKPPSGPISRAATFATSSGVPTRPASRNFDHALVPWTAWTRELILGQRREDDPPADRVDAGAALALADCLSHDAQRIAALRYLVGAQRVLDLVRLQHG